MRVTLESLGQPQELALSEIKELLEILEAKIKEDITVYGLEITSGVSSSCDCDGGVYRKKTLHTKVSWLIRSRFSLRFGGGK